MGLQVYVGGFVCALAAMPLARAADDEVETKSVLYCAASTSDFRVDFAASATTVPKGYGTAEPFNPNVLIKTTKPKPNGDVFRAGTRVKHLHCGDVTIDVRGGFYNSNPQGELGAADDFGALTIIRGRNKIEVSLLEDSCADAQSARAQAAWGEHPVQAVEGHKMGAGYQLTLFKSVCDDKGGAKPATETITWPD